MSAWVKLQKLYLSLLQENECIHSVTRVKETHDMACIELFAGALAKL